MNKYLYIISVSALLCSCVASAEQQKDKDITINDLAYMFKEPPMEYRPYVWWHWMGSNFSKEGITKDLEAMKKAGIGGATIFNLTSAVQESQAPIENNPWPEQTYRSKAYWEALEHAASEAKRLGLKLGMQNTPGYSTTGGPWITEERGMQTLVSSQVNIKGNRIVELSLKVPELPVYKGWGASNKQATYYKDIAVMAVPDKNDATVSEVIDLSDFMDSDGLLKWNAPSGTWTVYRIGHAPTMANPHPLPDDLIGKVLEADKMSKEQSIYHWQNILDPLVEHLHDYIGTTFTHILIDSYEAGDQNWTPGFRNEFIKQKGYDPLPWIALRNANKKTDEIVKFDSDFKDVINRLYIDNGWKVAKEMINKAGLQFYWEPYHGPFNTTECVSIPDLPMGEFWTGGDGAISSEITNAAKASGKRLVGAEAFTGRPEISQYTEDPAFLKHSTDGSFLSGVNMLFLHHWVHQPFDDKYQPGMGMGWWGTHFGRNQTWIKPGKAYFTYLTRCQMLLQQGSFISTKANILHRSMTDAEIYFVINPSQTELTDRFAFDVKGRVPELWYADKGVIQRIHHWEELGDSTYVNLTLLPDESVFVIFPKNKNNKYKDILLPAIDIIQESEKIVGGSWKIDFEPKLDAAFEQEFTILSDFSQHTEPSIKYFSGTATYKKDIEIGDLSMGEDKRIILDLGELNDIAEVKINGTDVGVLWYPPYKMDITSWLKLGNNMLEIAITNNWANRLIGDDQYPADFEWGEDRGIERGRAIKAFPDWFIKKQPRPSKDRKAFYIWYYHRKDSPLQPAGLIGPVRLIEQKIKVYD